MAKEGYAMGRGLSMDLRERMVLDGSSCRHKWRIILEWARVRRYV